MKSAIGLLILVLGAGGCQERHVQTNLQPDGPPEIMQVLMQGRVTLDSGSARTLTQLAYGSHPDINDDTSIDDLSTTIGPVTSGLARGNKLRVVFDELLVGNYLEEIACNDGSYSSVPRGATPDDIAKCSGTEPNELIDCTGDWAVCITADGPVGILDEDKDGAVDDMRLKDKIVHITCDGVPVTIHPEQSFYQPAGNQLISAGPLGVNSLGPALIVVPADPSSDEFSGMRTGATCSLSLSNKVVDKDDIQPCAPADGDECTPGDLSGLTWTIEALRVAASNPPAPPLNPATNVALTTTISIQFDAAIDPDTLGSITLADESMTFPTCDNPPVAPCITRTRNAADPTLVSISVTGGLTPSNMHTVTIGTGVTDVFGGAYPAESTITFTTRAM